MQPGEQRLIALDPLTGSGVPIGFTGNHDIRGLALDPATNTLYAADCKGNQLMIVNLTTGQALPVGKFGFTDVNGLAFDPVTGTLYGADGTTDNLITIDTATGAGTIVGPLGLSGFVNVTGLAFDPDAGVLFGSNVTSNQLVTIDTATGNATVVGPFGFLQVPGLAFDPASDTLYGTDIESGNLITIDTATGLGTAVGPYSTSIFDTGAVVVFEDFLPTETYCTAGTSASGCQALIGASGKASATAASGFSLLIAGVEGQKDGLYFFGTNGRQANSWGNGTSYVCVIPPRKRAGLLDWRRHARGLRREHGSGSERALVPDLPQTSAQPGSRCPRPGPTLVSRPAEHEQPVLEHVRRDRVPRRSLREPRGPPTEAARPPCAFPRAPLGSRHRHVEPTSPFPAAVHLNGPVADHRRVSPGAAGGRSTLRNLLI